MVLLSDILVNGAVYLYMATKLVQSLVTYKSMPADQLAMANTEIDLNEIPEGQVRPIWNFVNKVLTS